MNSNESCNSSFDLGEGRRSNTELLLSFHIQSIASPCFPRFAIKSSMRGVEEEDMAGALEDVCIIHQSPFDDDAPYTMADENDRTSIVCLVQFHSMVAQIKTKLLRKGHQTSRWGRFAAVGRVVSTLSVITKTKNAYAW